MRWRVLVGSGVVLLAALIVAGVVSIVDGGSHPSTSASSRSEVASTPRRPRSARSWHKVAPETTVPASSPVQQQYDAGFARGFASARNHAMMTVAEQLSLPAPRIADGWPQLAAANSPESWTASFVRGLLDIDFAREHRSDLGSWLVAESAPDLMPGIPTSFASRSLVVSVLDPSITGQLSPVPSRAAWARAASSGLRWSVHELEIGVDPAWQQMIDAGWQPPDIRGVVEDVTGVLDVARGPSIARHRFSLVVQLGSAIWHEGYGTALVSNFTEA